MRFLLIGSFFALALSLTAVGQERPEDVVKAAIAVAGGEEVLMKYPAGRVVGKGTMTFAGSETSYTFEQIYQVPGRSRTVVRCEVKGQKWELIHIVNDAAARQTINGRPIPLSDAAMKDLQMAVILNDIGQLTPLSSDKKFTIKFLKQDKPVDTAAVLVQVKGYPEIRLHFDRKSKHLVRCAYKAVDPDSSKEVELETSFDEFKSVSGLTRPTQSTVMRDGKKVIEMQVEKFTPLERFDPKAFALDE
jgi:hypothetical protein